VKIGTVTALLAAWIDTDGALDASRLIAPLHTLREPRLRCSTSSGPASPTGGGRDERASILGRRKREDPQTILSGWSGSLLGASVYTQISRDGL